MNNECSFITNVLCCAHVYCIVFYFKKLAWHHCIYRIFKFNNIFGMFVDCLGLSMKFYSYYY